MAKKKLEKNQNELDQFLEFIKKGSKDAPYGVSKRIGDYVFAFRVRKRKIN